MRIEILVGNSEEPLIFPLNKPKLTLGSGETCDIIVDAPNISRKHVQILCEGDNFYVVDQGSTNGTFINEERLVPGRRTEFTSFFPVRLGDLVLITLLSDEETDSEQSPLTFPEGNIPELPSAKSRSSDESTQMISLGDLRKAKTSDLVNRRKEIVKKKSVQAKKTDKKTVVKSKRVAEKKRMQKIQLLVVLILGAAAYVNFYVFEKEEDKTAKMGEVIPQEKPAVVETKQEPPPSKLIPETELTQKDRLSNLLTDIKCTLDTEKYFCSTIYKANEGQFGAAQLGAMMNVLVDGEFYFEEAKKLHPMPATNSPDNQHTPEELSQYEESLKELAGALFVLRAIPPDFNYETVKDFKMTFALFTRDAEGIMYPRVAVAVTPESLSEIKRLFEETHIRNVTKIGLNAIAFTRTYYRFY